MSAFTTLLVALQVAGIVGLAVVAVVAWRRRETRGALPLAGTTGGSAIWNLMVLGKPYVTDPQVHQLVEHLRYASVGLATAAFLVLALEYTGRERHLTRRNLALLAVEPVFVQVALATNPLHHRFYRAGESIVGITNSLPTFGIAFYIHMVYSFGIIFAGIGMFVTMLYRRQDLYRAQIAAPLIATIVPSCASIAYVFNLVPVNLTPTAFAISGAVLALAIFRVELTNLMPVARSTVVNNINDGVVVLDGDDRVIDLNPKGKRMLGVEDATAIGEYASVVLADYPGLWDHFQDLEEGLEEIEVETDRGRRSYKIEVSPLTDDRGRKSGRLFMIRDVTEERRRIEQLRRQNERLDQFASLVSHDLRNPLNVADGYLQAARDADDLDTVQDFLAEVEYSHDRMETLIEDVLTLAREGQTVDDPTPVDLSEVSRDAWRNVDTRDATLTVDATRRILADEDRLLRAFENCFRNAIEHAGEDVNVRVGTIGEFEPGSVLDTGRRGFYVVDDGPGIPEAKRERVLEDGYTSSEDGTGLGLSIVASVVEAHGWEMTVTEGRDGGARFEITAVEYTGAVEQSTVTEECSPPTQ